MINISLTPFLSFKVRDTGIGISEENINQLFREFGKLTLDKT
jgi:signal transduction histidine kinase